MHRFLWLSVLFLGAGTAASEAPPAAPTLAEAESEVLAAETDVQLQLEYTPDSPAERRWFIHAGFINAYPRLKSETLIEALNKGVRIIAPGFDDVMTVTDLREDHLLLPPQIGFGYVFNDKWSFAAQAGVSWGTVRTKADDISIFLLPLHSDFSILRGAWFVGAGIDYFPFRMVEQRRRDGVWDRIRGTRPYVGGSLTLTKAWFESKIKLGFPVLPNLAVTLEDEWLIASINLHLGLDVPITKHGSLAINFGRNFFAEEQSDFEGTALSVEWKQFLKPRNRTR